MALFAACALLAATARAADILPVVRIQIPNPDWVSVYIWDVASGAQVAHQASWAPGYYDFAVPAGGRWYWAGVWDHTLAWWTSFRWIYHQP